MPDKMNMSMNVNSDRNKINERGREEVKEKEKEVEKVKERSPSPTPSTTTTSTMKSSSKSASSSILKHKKEKENKKKISIPDNSITQDSTVGLSSVSSPRPVSTPPVIPTLAPSPSALLFIDPSFDTLPWEGLKLLEQFFGGEEELF